MLAFSPGNVAFMMPTTVETATKGGGNVSYIRLVNESATVQTVYYCSSATPAEVIGTIRLRPSEVMVLWKRRQAHKMYASSAEVWGTGGMARPASLK